MASIISRLPMESALRTELRDQYTDEQLAAMYAENTSLKHGPWSRGELLFAALVNDMRNLIHVQLLRGGVKDAPPPEPVRVPGSPTFRKSADPKAVAYLQAIRDRHAKEVS